MSYSYDRTGRGANVPQTVAKMAVSKALDLAWVEGLRKDFLTLMKNLPRVKDYQTALKLQAAFRTYRNNFNNTLFDNFLNKLKKGEIDLGDDSNYIDRTLRQSGWNFSLELSLPISHADDYHGEEARFSQYQHELPKWKGRMERRAREFWKDMKSIIDYLEKANKPGMISKIPTVDNTVLDGFRVQMVGFEEGNEYHQQILSKFREGLKQYKQSAAVRVPILLQKQCPIVVEFKATLDKGGEYSQGVVTFYGSSVIGSQPAWVAHVMAHEMGHHLWKTYLSGEAQKFWTDTIRGDYGDLDLAELLRKWPDGAWAFEFTKYIGKTDPIMALQVEALGQNDPGAKGQQSKEDFQKLYDSGTRTLRVPKTPITGYANKNPEEAFCETIGLLVAYGSRAVHERVRWWLDTVMPGDVRLAKVK